MPPVRFYTCPLVIEPDGGRHAKVAEHMPGDNRFRRAVVRCSTLTWAVVQCAGADLSVIPDTDLDCDDVLEKLMDAFNTRAQAINYLTATTLGDLPAPRRRRIGDRLTARGVDISAFTAATTLKEALVALCDVHGTAGIDGMGV